MKPTQSLDTVTTLNSTSSLTGNQKSWSLDALGNWNSVTTDSTTSTRSSNSQNEITAASGYTSPAYDSNGNMTTDELGNVYTYDAWNQVMKIQNSALTVTREVYQYDALGRATLHSNGTGNAYYYYSGQRQMIEDVNVNTYLQMVYGMAYVNAVILRDRNADHGSGTGSEGKTGSGLEEREYVQQDTNWSTISLRSKAGTLVERMIYDAYGTVTFLNGSTWAVTSDSALWLYLFQGMRLSEDGQNNIYMSMTRFYDSTLGVWTRRDPAGYFGDSAQVISPSDLAAGNFEEPRMIVSNVVTSATATTFSVGDKHHFRPLHTGNVIAWVVIASRVNSALSLCRFELGQPTDGVDFTGQGFWSDAGAFGASLLSGAGSGAITGAITGLIVGGPAGAAAGAVAGAIAGGIAGGFSGGAAVISGEINGSGVSIGQAAVGGAISGAAAGVGGGLGAAAEAAGLTVSTGTSVAVSAGANAVSGGVSAGISSNGCPTSIAEGALVGGLLGTTSGFAEGDYLVNGLLSADGEQISTLIGTINPCGR